MASRALCSHLRRAVDYGNGTGSHRKNKLPPLGHMLKPLRNWVRGKMKTPGSPTHFILSQAKKAAQVSGPAEGERKYSLGCGQKGIKKKKWELRQSDIK